jgi:carboxypeptidase C (cathepsin A)
MTDDKTVDKEEKKVEEKPAPKDELVETKHSVVIGGKEIHYTVTTGTLVLKEETEKVGEKEGTSEGEKAKAAIFFIAYTRDDVEDRSKRPLTFSFNGGPGSASVWLHLGVLGPRRVQMDEIGNSLPPPYRLIDNEYSMLDMTDLVFIDPVSTGYSRPVVGEKGRNFTVSRKTSNQWRFHKTVYNAI